MENDDLKYKVTCFARDNKSIYIIIIAAMINVLPNYLLLTTYYVLVV